MQPEGENPSEDLITLNIELDQLGLSQAHPNPYFSNFARAMSRNPKFRRPDFSADEYDEIKKLSDSILSDSISKGAI
jgi:hypothetical protein